MAYIKLSKSIATWNVSYVATSGTQDVIANFSDGGLQRALVCETALAAADMKAVEEIQLDMSMDDMAQLNKHCRDPRMTKVLQEAFRAALDTVIPA